MAQACNEPVAMAVTPEVRPKTDTGAVLLVVVPLPSCTKSTYAPALNGTVDDGAGVTRPSGDGGGAEVRPCTCTAVGRDSAVVPSPRTDALSGNPAADATVGHGARVAVASRDVGDAGGDRSGDAACALATRRHRTAGGADATRRYRVARSAISRERVEPGTPTGEETQDEQ